VKRALCIIFSLLGLALLAAEAGKTRPAPPEIRQIEVWFAAETAALADWCLASAGSLAGWEAGAAGRRRKLQEMLGLLPMPERTDLKAVTTGRIERDEFIVEKLHFQASPRLYVTANLYLPRGGKAPFPAILYVCGHSRAVAGGVSYGNKTGYHHHGIWFARNGYVCLVIDTLQMGEIQGSHRGTYSEGQWWWNSRGFTPAGVETWFGIRALDYLCSRPEVDAQRIGMTGRSGGGAYTWFVAALDDRVKVAAPVAGITDLRNHVVDGTIEGHCDCMFPVNTYRWDFAQLAAMIAPRPLLIGNSDKDRIFPLDGVMRLHRKVRGVYELYGKTNHLGLLITEGPHADTQDLQLPVFRWFNRFLRSEDPVIEMAATRQFQPSELRVFEQLPADQINTRIPESFVPKADPGAALSPERIEELRTRVFGGWPLETAGRGFRQAEPLAQSQELGVVFKSYSFDTQPGLSLLLHTFRSPKVSKPKRVILEVLDSRDIEKSLAGFLWRGEMTRETCAPLRSKSESEKALLAFFAPRGAEPTDWLHRDKRAPQVRRRFMLLGQTLDGMRVWDIRRCVQAAQSIREIKGLPIEVIAASDMGVNAAYAALFEPGISKLRLRDLPASHQAGPDYLNILRFTDIPEVLQWLGERAAAGTRIEAGSL
jgi:dienelactone hydrolase